ARAEPGKEYAGHHARIVSDHDGPENGTPFSVMAARRSISAAYARGATRRGACSGTRARAARAWVARGLVPSGREPRSTGKPPVVPRRFPGSRGGGARVAQHFGLRPGGTRDNSPALQCWGERPEKPPVPPGRGEVAPLPARAVPPGRHGFLPAL